MVRPESVGRPFDGGQSGSTLILALFVLTLLGGLGISLLFVTRGGINTGRADLRAKQAFFLAEAGFHDGRQTLFLTNGKGDFDDDLGTAYGVDDSPGFDPDTLAPVYDASGSLTGFTGYGDDVPLRGLTALGAGANAGSYAAFLTNDPAEVASKDDTDDRVMISAVGVGQSGSMEIVQVMIELESLFGLPPATITLMGPTPSFWGGDSNAKKYLGDDCSDPGLSVPTVGAIGPTAQAAVQAGVDKPLTYESNGVTGTASVGDVDSVVDPSWKDCGYWIELAQRIKNRADVVGDASTPATQFGTIGNPKTVYIADDYSLPGSVDFAGLFWVTGHLTLDGNASWDGTIFVVGRGSVSREFGGSGTTSGAIVVVNVAGPDQTLFTADDCSGPDGIAGNTDDGNAGASYVNNGGGNHTVEYCLAAIETSMPALPYRLTGFLQR